MLIGVQPSATTPSVKKRVINISHSKLDRVTGDPNRIYPLTERVVRAADRLFIAINHVNQWSEKKNG